jgi:enoyl-CoA hydratase/carnithine racemase
MNAPLRITLNSAILRITLDDPLSRNSLSELMLASLRSELVKAQNDERVSVIIIAAEPPVFCAGHNLKELMARRDDADLGAAYFAQLFNDCSQLMMQISHHRCAIVAEVNGLASAAGCQLVASCDLAYASSDAQFCTPGVNIGLFCSTPMVALSRNVEDKHALEMLLTGDVFDALHARRIGLINAVMESSNLTSHVGSVAAKIASKSQNAIQHGKQLFYEQRNMDLPGAYQHCSKTMVKNMLDDSAREGISAFLEKRKPIWQP